MLGTAMPGCCPVLVKTLPPKPAAMSHATLLQAGGGWMRATCPEPFPPRRAQPGRQWSQRQADHLLRVHGAPANAAACAQMQADQPEVKAALAHAALPEVQASRGLCLGLPQLASLAGSQLRCKWSLLEAWICHSAAAAPAIN